MLGQLYLPLQKSFLISIGWGTWWTQQLILMWLARCWCPSISSVTNQLMEWVTYILRYCWLWAFHVWIFVTCSQFCLTKVAIAKPFGIIFARVVEILYVGLQCSVSCETCHEMHWIVTPKSSVMCTTCHKDILYRVQVITRDVFLFNICFLNVAWQSARFALYTAANRRSLWLELLTSLGRGVGNAPDPRLDSKSLGNETLCPLSAAWVKSYMLVSLIGKLHFTDWRSCSVETCEMWQEGFCALLFELFEGAVFKVS